MVGMNGLEIQGRLGRNVRRLRKERHLTQFQLAEKAGVSEETIKNIELCRCWVSEKTLAQLSQSLAVDVCQLFLPVDELSGYENAIAVQIRQGISQSLKLSSTPYSRTFLCPAPSCRPSTDTSFSPVGAQWWYPAVHSVPTSQILQYFYIY